MKKPNPEAIEWAQRRELRKALREIREANLQLHAKSHGRELKRRTGRRRSKTKTSVFAVPTLLAERESTRAKILDLLRSMWTALANGNSKIKLDFSRTNKIYPGGMLLLIAHVALMLESFPRRISAKCVPNSMAAQLLRHFGYADRLGVGASISRPRHESVVNWRHVSGSNADGTIITALLNDLRGDTKAVIPEGLYEVLTEALTNVSHHAYPGDYDLPESMRKWWIFSRLENPLEEEEGNLYIGIYDVGVGIQMTMRQKLQSEERILSVAEDWADWLTWPSRLLDQKLLSAAVEHKRSSTGLSFRGNGLPEMRDFVLQTESGSLSIVSGLAQYTCQAESPGSKTYRCSDGIMGTLILWSIPLKHKESS